MTRTDLVGQGSAAKTDVTDKAPQTRERCSHENAVHPHGLLPNRSRMVSDDAAPLKRGKRNAALPSSGRDEGKA